jgi:ADP-ribose pyrophosphatase
MRPWRRLDSRPLLRNQLCVDEDLVLLPSGSESRYVVMREGAFTCICAVTTGGLVGLVEQYRYPLERVTCELPAGAIETGESPEEAGRRELREEAGLTGGTWESMGSFWTMPGRSTQKVHLFLVRGVVATAAPSVSGTEETRLVLKPFDEALAAVSSVRDALCLRLALERS